MVSGTTNISGSRPTGRSRQARTQHRGNNAHGKGEENSAEETRGIDARFRCGKIDVSELPSAHKNAGEVQDEMAEFGLAEVIDRIKPHVAAMAGD